MIFRLSPLAMLHDFAVRSVRRPPSRLFSLSTPMFIHVTHHDPSHALISDVVTYRDIHYDVSRIAPNLCFYVFRIQQHVSAPPRLASRPCLTMFSPR
ncbi:hypothetical protein C8T65DRAFT_610020 [Cerioporus squamosus]|nr:hypothetical protein C8T65DRAFT_610020 [Cerioporus squamosus]